MNKGFTMVELLVTIVILASIAIIAMPAYTNVTDSIKNSNLENKKKTISSAMLKFANTYLIDEIKPHGVVDCSGNNCCKAYDLYKYIVAKGIYTADRNDKNTGEPFIENSVANTKLEGCIKVKYNLTKYLLEAEWVDTCITPESGYASC